jgi:hypothetical protein
MVTFKTSVRRIVVVAVIASTALLMTGCSSDDGAGVARHAIRYFLFADGSLSVKSEQAQRWAKAANSLVFDRLNPGDAVVVYAITDRTDESAPLCDIEIPAASDDDGYEAGVIALTAIERARKEGTEAVQSALTARVRSKETRLLDALRRIRIDPHRDTRAVFLTDALESSASLDLEKTPLTAASFSSIVDTAVTQRRWTKGLLKGVKVQFVLNSPNVNERRSLNDHESLERFWRSVLTTLDADLIAFDSRIAQ